MGEILSHRHHSVQFTIPLDGAKGIVRKRLPSGKWHDEPVASRQIICIPAGVEHSARWDFEAEAIEIYIAPGFLQELSADKVAALFGRTSLPETASDGVICEQIGTIAIAAPEIKPDSFLITETAKLLVSRLVKAHAKPSVATTGPKLSERHRFLFNAYIYANIAVQFGVPELAKAVSISASHLTILCQNTYGESPMKYVLACRLAKAHAIALKGEIMAKEIARVCGFHDTSYLNRRFKRRYKKTVGVLLKQSKSLFCPSGQ